MNRPVRSSTRSIALLAGVAILLLLLMGALVLPRTPAPLAITESTITSTLVPTGAAQALPSGTATGTAISQVPTNTAVSSATPEPAATAAASGPAGLSAADTLATLRARVAPARDLYQLTMAVKLGRPAVPPTSPPAPPARQVGDHEVFQVGDTANGSYYPVTATLRLVTAHVYWWSDDAGEIDLAGLRASADRFETRVYPGDTATFGLPAATGPDGDPHINVLNTDISGAAGYFSAADMYPRAMNPFSNARKMIYAGVPPGGDRYEALLAHEFQHMIHWNIHPDQNVWINEGMAELAMKISGYDTGGPESVFMSKPDTQLNNWATPPNAAIPHYGAAYLFMNYLYGRYGADLIRSILAAPGADTEAIDQAFAAQGKPDTFQSVFTDWALANWLDKTSTDPRYRYDKLQVQVDERTTLPAPNDYEGTVAQQAADYLVIPGARAAGELTVTFDGDPTVPLIPVPAHSGHGLWWSGRGDVSAPSLTRALDLRNTKAATLTYWTWYDTEADYDYGYVETSTDGGQTWATLPAPATTDTNPNGNNLGHGYTGESGGSPATAWIEQRVDLSAYAGKAIQIRFAYVTDDGYNADGFAIDDIAVPEIGYKDDAEAPGASGWQAAGWVHVDPTLPQQWVVRLITTAADGTPHVDTLPLDAANHGSLPIPATTDRAVLMVAPLAPETTQPGHYRVTIR